MKGFDSKNMSIDSNVENEGMDMQIDAADMGFVYDLLFSQMYRDPIGSVIREITSNCFDSHIEAGVTDAVVISVGEDDAGYYIEFKDVGVGLSPERMEKVYRKPAKSTKRDTNGQIGYFGLGSKSPLSYDDSFFLTTVADGVRYEYIVHKGEKSPRIEKLNEEETDEKNGTVVRINIKDIIDYGKFLEKLPVQLRYFDNVFVKGTYRFNNSYKLHEGKTFKFRNDVSEDEELHLCIGKVYYPIDWNRIGRKVIYFPMGLKFDIGELPITPERESVRYITLERDGEEIAAADLINAKIDAFIEEMKELESQIVRDHNNLADYYENMDSKSYVELLGRKIDTSDLVPDRKHTYQPFAEAGIKLPENPFWLYEAHAYIRIKKTEMGAQRLSWKMLQTHLVIREFSPAGKIAQVKLDYMRHLAKEKGKQTVFFVRRINPYWRDIRDYLGLANKGKNKSNWIHQQNLEFGNWAQKWLFYKQQIETELFIHSLDINDIVVPEDYERQWKEEHRIRRARVNYDQETEIPLEDVRVAAKASRKRAMNLADLNNGRGFILWGFADDLSLLENWAKAFSYGMYEKEARIYQIRQKDEKYFYVQNAINVRYFMSVENPVFKRVATAIIIKDAPFWKRRFYPLAGAQQAKSLPECSKLLEMVFEPLAKTVVNLDNKAKSTINMSPRRNEEEYNDFLTEVKDIALKNDWIEEDVKKDINRVNGYLKDLDLMEYIAPDEKGAVAIAEYFKLKGKKVNPILFEPEQWERELLLELQAKFNYLAGVKEQLSAQCSKVSHWQNEGKPYYMKYVVLSNFVDRVRPHITDISLITKYHDKTIKTSV